MSSLSLAVGVGLMCALLSALATNLAFLFTKCRGDRAANGRAFGEAWWQGGVRERAARARRVDRHAHDRELRRVLTHPA